MMKRYAGWWLLAAVGWAWGISLAQPESLEGRLKSLFEEQVDLKTIERTVAQSDHISHYKTSEELAFDLSDGLQDKISRQRDTLLKNAHSILDIYLSSSSSSSSANVSLPLLSCCDVRESLLRYDAQFGAYVNDAFGCHLASPDLDRYAASNLSLTFRRTLLSSAVAGTGLKWQYFVSTDGDHLEYPAARVAGCGLKGDVRHRSVYLSTLHPPSRVVFLFDRDLSSSHLDLGRAVVHYMVSSLSDRDLVGFVAVSEDVYYPLGPDCSVQTFSNANADAKRELSKFMNVVHPSKGKTDHVSGIRAVENLIRNSDIGRDETVRIMYISRGNVEDVSEKKRVFEALATMRRTLAQEIVINSYYLIDEDSRRSTFEVQYLQQVSAQNFRAHNFDVEKDVVPGKFVEVESAQNLGRRIGDFLQPTVHKLDENAQLISPYWDPVGRGMVFSFAKPIFSDEKVIGVTGLDVHFDDFLEEFLYFNKADGSFACLLQRHGGRLNVIYHPALYENEGIQLSHSWLDDIERIEEDQELVDRILTLPSGNRSINRWSSHTQAFSDSRMCGWKWVDGTDLVVLVIGSSKEHKPDSTENDVGTHRRVDIPHMYYHRLDVLLNSRRETSLCKNHRSLSTRDTGTLYLSPMAFSSPFRHRQDHLTDTSKSYMAYLTDQTGLLANPGLKQEVKPALGLLSQVLDGWKDMAAQSREPYVVERFIYSPSGVYLSLPGARMPANFEVRHTNWYQQAMKHPDIVAFSGPRLHPSGAGHTITISKAITKPGSQVPESVVGVSVSLGRVTKLLNELMPECEAEVGLTCFIFDQDGTLVSHPIMSDPTYIGSIEGQHLNHKEPNVGKDLLNHEAVMKKMFCRSFPHQTVRRFYQFNLNMTEEFTSSIHGDSCNWYSIRALRGTNLFLGQINATCPSATVFCPCSINGKKCIFCDNSEEEARTSCECPCECPMKATTQCTVGDEDYFDDLPACEAEPNSEGNHHLATSHGIRNLEECFPVNCPEEKDKSDCNAKAGCAWCEVQLEVDPEFSAPSFSPIQTPYCAAQDQCFRGAVGSNNPYENHGRDKMVRDRTQSQRSSHVGPIIGGILVFFVFMGFSVFCYRFKFGGDEDCGSNGSRRLFRHQNHSYRGNNIEVDEDEEEELKAMHGGGHHNVIALAQVDAVNSAAVLSPYKMNPGYRRPPLGTDSDNGYSTMTPLGGDLDSEIIMPYTASAPARSRLRHRPPASLQSVTSGVSSRTSSPVPPSSSFPQPASSTAQRLQTQVEIAEERPKGVISPDMAAAASPTEQTMLNPNQIIVSATVHMVDTQ